MRHYEFSIRTEDGVRLYGQGWERDGAPRATVCLVHGLGDHSGRYGPVAAHLNEAGYAVLAYDQRGHGKSDGKRGHSPSYDRTMDDIALLLAEASARYPGSPRFLYGHSLGGSLVLNYALRRKPTLEGVIATSPGLRPAMPVAGWKQALMGPLYNRMPGLQMPNGLDITGISRNPEVISAYRRDPLVHDRASVRFGADILSSGEWALEHAREFSLPLLLLHGSADRVTCPNASAEFASKMNGPCTFTLVGGGYHELHNEPESHQVLDAVVAWLDQHTPTRSGEHAS
jgi:alpha-beta hydrolase superfamily lysophospholipase